MTLVNIDLRNQGYETGPDDRVVFYSLLVREGDFGTISTAPVDVPLVDGKATVDLVPGPVGVQIIAGQVADTRVKIGEVPPSGPTTLGAVMMVTPAYTPELQKMMIAAIERAKEIALTRVASEAARAIDSKVEAFKVKAEDALAKSMSAEAKSDSAISKSSNAVDRVTALESMAGLIPESPVDGQTANLISQPGTLTSQALTQKTDNLLSNAPMLVTFGIDTETDRPATNRPVMWIGYGVPFHRQAGDIVVQAVMEWPVHLDLITWYDATTAGPAGGGITIPDRGPNGINMVNTVGSVTVESGGINPVFAFDNGMISNAGLGFDPTLWAYPLTVYLVASVDNTSEAETLFDTVHATHRATISRTPDGRLSVVTSSTKQSPSGTFPADTPVIISVSITTEGFVGEVNGVPVVTATDIATPTDPVTRLRLGGNYGGSFRLNGSLGEAIVARGPTPSDHTSTLEYLSEKWGITL